MKKIIVALTLVLASGYAVNAVYAASPIVKSELTKDGDKEKKKKKGSTTKTETKSCSGTSTTSGKSCCAGKK